jgi:hypothetical protein
VVILFAEFVTHRGHDKRLWQWLHWLCAVFAWLSLAVSLAVLGDMSLRRGGWSSEIKDFEGPLRWTVGVLVVISGGILALDVGSLDVTSSARSHRKRKDGRDPGGNGNRGAPGGGREHGDPGSDGTEERPTGRRPPGRGRWGRGPAARKARAGRRRPLP